MCVFGMLGAKSGAMVAALHDCVLERVVAVELLNLGSQMFQLVPGASMRCPEAVVAEAGLNMAELLRGEPSASEMTEIL